MPCQVKRFEFRKMKNFFERDQDHFKQWTVILKKILRQTAVAAHEITDIDIADMPADRLIRRHSVVFVEQQPGRQINRKKKYDSDAFRQRRGASTH